MSGPAIDRNRNRGNRSIEDLASAAKTTGGLAPGTIEKYEGQIRIFKAWAKDEENIIDVTDKTIDLPELLVKFLCFRIVDQVFGKSSLDSAYSALNWFYTYDQLWGNSEWKKPAAGSDLYDGNPYNDIRVASTKRYLKRETKSDIRNKSYACTLNDLIRIFDILDRMYAAKKMSNIQTLRFKAMFSLGFFCWFRVDELESLKVGHISEETGGDPPDAIQLFCS